MADGRSSNTGSTCQANKKSLVQCRIEACKAIDDLVDAHKDDEKPLSVRKAMLQLASETGVPFGTLERWYYADDESRKSTLKTEGTQGTESSAKTKAKVVNRIVKNINKALDKDEEDALAAAANRDGAMALASELGDVVVAEELYELYLKQVAKVDEIINANKELSDPIRADSIISQLLRMARNAGWEEPVVEEVESNTCNKCVVKSCPNRTCENHKPKKKKQVKGKVKAKGEK